MIVPRPMTSDRHAPSWRRVVGIWLAAAMSLVVALKAPLTIWSRDGIAEAFRALSDWTYYNVAFLSASYWDAGFVRRGLGGTIAKFLAADAVLGALLLHVASAILLIGAFALVQWRYLRATSIQTAAFMIMFAVLSPQLFGGWADDIGRTDMLVIAAIAWAVIAMDSGRPLVSSALLVVGFLVHETAIIFGAPLLIATATLSVRDGCTSVRDLRRATVLLFIALASIVVVQTFTTPSAASFSASMLRNTPAPIDAWHRDLRDCAIYMMIAGMRGLRTAICYNFYWPAFGLMVIFSVGVTLFNGFILGLERRAFWFAFAALVPMLFMNAVANDSGRWVKFASANAWLLAALYMRRGEIVPQAWRLVVNIILFAGMCYMGSSPVHEVNRASLSAARQLGFLPAPEVADWMTQCDLRWREVAQGREKP
ncbi:MAG TPA: hypothetical protein VF637_14505 [Sphingomicrobium sp.]